MNTLRTAFARGRLATVVAAASFAADDIPHREYRAFEALHGINS